MWRPDLLGLQIPRIDITLPGNAMDYHPALLAEEGDEDSDDEGLGLSESLGLGLGDGDEMELEEPAHLLLDPEDDASQGQQGAAALLHPAHAAKLLVLLTHARNCLGLHKDPRHADVCRAAKYLMLHVRDCDGKVR